MEKFNEILCIGPNPSNQGGIETFVRNLSFFFGKQISFYSVTPNESLHTLEEKIIIYDNCPKNKFLRVLNQTFKMYFFRKYNEKYDIFILNNPSMINLLKKSSKKVKILVQHQTAEIYWKRKAYFNQNNNLVKKIRNEIDIVITLSPFDREEFIKKFDLDSKKVRFIRHTSHMPLLCSEKERNKNLIIVCRLDNHHKRLDLAIKAMKKLSDYTLNIYGSGKDESMLKELSKDICNVILHGSTNKVQDKLDENGIYIMTSDYEGYGISLVEAMRRGLPIILRDTYTAARDILQGNGVLLKNEWDEDEFIKAVKFTYKNYEKCSKKSLELGKRHDFEIIEKEWKNLIETMEDK